MKRVLAVFLAVSLLMGAFTISASAAEATDVKQDISGAYVGVGDQEFIGSPVTPTVYVTLNGKTLTAATDYVVLYENNINIGTATVRVVGRGKYCGSVEKEFQITYGDTTVTMPGAYNGSASGELNDQVYYAEGYLSPGTFRGYTDCDTLHEAYYALYRIDGETPTLILEETKEEGIHNDTMFTYDFSAVYDSKTAAGGEAYILAYSWITRFYDVYSGVLVMHVPAKVAPGTSMQVEQLPDVGSFRHKYLSYHSENGALELPQWTSSDPSVATVENGVVTLKKPGSVTITAKCGNLTDGIELTAEIQDLTQGSISTYSAGTGKASVFYDGYLLEEGTDYTQAVSVQGGVTEVTVTGKNLFTGQLVQQFDAAGPCSDHSHGFAYPCDTTCSSCDYVRTAAHTYSTEWTKDETHHWHACTACGEKADNAAHTLSPEDPETCTVCGTLYAPGDVNGDFAVNNKDVEHLLWYTLFPESYPLQTDADLDGDGKINNKDVEYLLWHTLFPESYPL